MNIELERCGSERLWANLESISDICLEVLRKDGGTSWHSWLSSCATNRKVAGSIPDGIIGIFLLSGRSMALVSTQPLTVISKSKVTPKQAYVALRGPGG
jgi:hypothetical protein